jgi:hypothetical protein
MAGHGGLTVITTLANNKSNRGKCNKLGALKSQVRLDYIRVQRVTLMGNLVSTSNNRKVESLVEKDHDGANFKVNSSMEDNV